MRAAHRILVGNLEGRRQLGRLRIRWEDNIKMDPRERAGGVVWILLIRLKIRSS
jgi:hypothetical protein